MAPVARSGVQVNRGVTGAVLAPVPPAAHVKGSSVPPVLPPIRIKAALNDIVPLQRIEGLAVSGDGFDGVDPVTVNMPTARSWIYFGHNAGLTKRE